MPIAVLSDLHANATNLRRALRRIESESIELVVCAGDVLDDGDELGETLRLLELARALCIRGNHERWALGRGAHVGRRGRIPLSPAHRARIEGWPTSLIVPFDGTFVAVHHASPRSDMDGLHQSTPERALEECLDRAGAPTLVVGHTHEAFVRRIGHRLVVNPGTLGAPNPGDRPTFAIVDGRRLTARIIALDGTTQES